MLLPMQDAWPAHPGGGYPMPTRAWQDEDGDIIEPMLTDPVEEPVDAPWRDDLADLIASRPSRHLRRTRPGA